MTNVDATVLTRRPPAAVLWDMDGTIVDTEQIWVDTAVAIVREYVPDAPFERLDELVGMALLDGAEVMRSLGVPLDAATIVDRQLGLVIDATRGADFDWRPGAV